MRFAWSAVESLVGFELIPVGPRDSIFVFGQFEEPRFLDRAVGSGRACDGSLTIYPDTRAQNHW